MAITKIAILGGGVGGVSSAFALTDPANPGGPYDITIYTAGWRLGGKGACGRMPDGRILEHGLHVWGGFYENAFRMMNRCYQELGRPPGTPMSVCFPPAPSREEEGAFRQANDVVFTERLGDTWSPWHVDFSEWCLSDCLPGTNDEPLKSLDFYFAHTLDLLLHAINNALGATDPLLDHSLQDLNHLLNLALSREQSATGPHDLLHLARSIVRKARHLFDKQVELGLEDILGALTGLLDRVRDDVWSHVAPVIETDTNLRRLWLVTDFAIAILRGVAQDNLFQNGFPSIEDVEWTEWLKRNGLGDYTLQSVLVSGYYDYFFAYLEGDPSKPCISAGSALLHLLRMVLTFDQAIYWKMNSGMGDAIFAPMYEVLKRRGVKFKFFHQVDRLELTPDGSELSAIHIGRQVDLANGQDEYLPLIQDCGGVPCWPGEPLYAQLDPQQAARLQSDPVVVEALDPNWPTTRVTLRAGEDFDGAILAITMDPLRAICQDLAASSQPAGAMWKMLLAENKTVQTIAAQVWFETELIALGWSEGPPVLTGFAQPHSTWSDMTHVLVREGWGVNGPKCLAYFCGQLQDSPELPAVWSPEFQAAQDLRAKELTIRWMEEHLPFVMPQSQWQVCFDTNIASGVERFNAQYWRANVSGPERYVLTLPGNHRYRPRQGRSGFGRLWVAGDWVFTCLGGCVEAAAISGMMASRAISGYPVSIKGEVSAEHNTGLR